MNTPDTSPEAVERLAGLSAAGIYTPEQCADMIRALSAERDRLRHELEAAEALIARLQDRPAEIAARRITPLQWRPAGYDGQSLEASALGLDVFYRITGRPGDWTLISPGPREYVRTPGYETRESARNAAWVDYRRRIEAALSGEDYALGQPAPRNGEG